MLSLGVELRKCDPVKSWKNFLDPFGFVLPSKFRDLVLSILR